MCIRDRTYTVIVSNYGPSVATNVYLTDLFNADELLNMEYNSNGNWVKSVSYTHLDVYKRQNYQ